MDQEQLQKPGYWAVLPAAVRYDPELPASAKILYAEISSLTDQRGFCFASNAYFQSLFGMTDRTVQRILKALQEHGYIRIENGSGGAGRRKIYAGINPLSDAAENTEQEPRQKCRGNPDKNVGDNKKENNIPPTSPPGGKRVKSKPAPAAPAWKPERFQGFWEFYPIHKSKQAAIRAWDRLRPGDELIAEIGKALRRQMATDLWTRGIGIPYPATYLNQRRWEDEVEEPAPDWKPDRFEEFWNFYPKSAQKNKQAAIKAWDQLRPSDELIADIGKALRRQMATDQWRREIGIPYPATYLRQRRWEDEIEETAPDWKEGPAWI